MDSFACVLNCVVSGNGMLKRGYDFIIQSMLLNYITQEMFIKGCICLLFILSVSAYNSSLTLTAGSALSVFTSSVTTTTAGVSTMI